MLPLCDVVNYVNYLKRPRLYRRAMLNYPRRPRDGSNVRSHAGQRQFGRLAVGFKCAPLATTEPIDAFEFVRTIAAARIRLPRAIVRLAAGRERMNDGVAGAVFPHLRELDVLRRQTADHHQAADSARPRAV